ncbi:MAG: Cupredoxin-like domain, partial [Proteobacteria bacterium]|nr:Cupredoxin-like domain [Pseudomonadota bacterium]
MLRRMLPILLVTLCATAFAAEPQMIEVKLESYAIKPDTITVKVGQPVTLKVRNEAT